MSHPGAVQIERVGALLPEGMQRLLPLSRLSRSINGKRSSERRDDGEGLTSARSRVEAVPAGPSDEPMVETDSPDRQSEMGGGAASSAAAAPSTMDILQVLRDMCASVDAALQAGMARLEVMQPAQKICLDAVEALVDGYDTKCRPRVALGALGTRTPDVLEQAPPPCQLWSSSTEFFPKSVKLGPSLTKCWRFRPNVVHLGPNLDAHVSSSLGGVQRPQMSVAPSMHSRVGVLPGDMTRGVGVALEEVRAKHAAPELREA